MTYNFKLTSWTYFLSIYKRNEKKPTKLFSILYDINVLCLNCSSNHFIYTIIFIFFLNLGTSQAQFIGILYYGKRDGWVS